MPGSLRIKDREGHRWDTRCRRYRAQPVACSYELIPEHSLAGSVWKPPYEVDVTRLLHAGANTIRVVVANLAINRLAGTSLPNYRLLNVLYGERFQEQDMKNVQPVPCGMLGPVTLTAR